MMYKTLLRIENGKGESVRDTTTRPKNRQQPKTTSWYSM